MAAHAAIQLAPDVWRIPTLGAALVNSFLLRNADGSATLIDTGLTKAPPRLLAALESLGLAPQAVTRILLTHGHPDHAGGARSMHEATGAPIAASTQDAAYVRMGIGPAPDASTFIGGKLMRKGGKFPAAPVAQEFSDGELIDVAGGLRVVATPGHTPGHVSFLHEPTRILITGDALFNWRRLRYPPTFLCTNVRRTKETAHVLGELDYSHIAFNHGPEIRTDAREQVRTFLRKEQTAL